EGDGAPPAPAQQPDQDAPYGGARGVDRDVDVPTRPHVALRHQPRAERVDVAGRGLLVRQVGSHPEAPARLGDLDLLPGAGAADREDPVAGGEAGRAGAGLLDDADAL